MPAPTPPSTEEGGADGDGDDDVVLLGLLSKPLGSLRWLVVEEGEEGAEAEARQRHPPRRPTTPRAIADATPPRQCLYYLDVEKPMRLMRLSTEAAKQKAAAGGVGAGAGDGGGHGGAASPPRFGRALSASSSSPPLPSDGLLLAARASSLRGDGEGSSSGLAGCRRLTVCQPPFILLVVLVSAALTILFASRCIAGTVMGVVVAVAAAVIIALLAVSACCRQADEKREEFRRERSRQGEQEAGAEGHDGECDGMLEGCPERRGHYGSTTSA